MAETIAYQIERIADEICDKICKWPEKYEEDEDRMYDEHCENCPLTKLL